MIVVVHYLQQVGLRIQTIGFSPPTVQLLRVFFAVVEKRIPSIHPFTEALASVTSSSLQAAEDYYRIYL
jgi:hypothetical protein